MKVISEEWGGGNSYNHMAIYIHSVILEGFYGSLNLFNLAFKGPEQTALILTKKI